MKVTHDSLTHAIEIAVEDLLDFGEPVNTTSWQGQSDPRFATIEITNFSFICSIPSEITELQKQIGPNLPWADHHFEERISRIPYNPPPSHKEWPFWRPSSEETKEVGDVKFSHTYPERYWPPAKPGIRYAWGDLDDVVHLLLNDPLTRQAYLPIFFPEDTGAGATPIGYTPRRVPCSLGYGFLCRENKLHIFYDIRSCDILRHFQDDIYLTCRLLLWVLGNLRFRTSREDNKFWWGVEPGNLSMRIYSLHCFEADIPTIIYRRKIGRVI